MKRIALSILLFVAIVLGLTSCQPGDSVVVFGDSLVVQSTTALKAQLPGVTVNAYGGTAVCNWTDQMKLAANNHSKVVIASFVGNLQPCDGTVVDQNYYTRMFLQVMYISNYYNDRHVPLYWAGYPVRGFPSFYQLGDWSKVQANYQYAASKYPQYVHWFDAGLTIAPNHVYTPSINGKTVRDPDKLHFTPYGGELYARELLKPAM